MYALVDCNNFYCSCETLFNPKLQGRPVVVLSNNDGCVISRSEEAKAIGIQMGTPEFMIRENLQAHKVTVFSSNYALYGDMSNRVMKTLAYFVPNMELYSIDECFLDMHHMPYTDLYQLGTRIRKTVKRNIGIPVCVGIAPTKTLAKMANRYAKQHKRSIGVHYAGDKNIIEEMLASTPTGDIWGIGKQYAALLMEHGFKNALEVSKAPEPWMKEHLTVVGQRLWKELNGIPAFQWENAPPPKKNICTGRSFGTMQTAFKEVKEALCNFAANCARKLRQQHSCARKVQVFLLTNTHRIQDQQYSRTITIEMDTPSNHTGTIIRYASKALEIIFREGYNYKKVGCIVMDLVPEDTLQMNLFSAVDSKKSNQLMQVVDKLNSSLGKDTVRMAVQGFERNYRLRADHISRCYTTRLEDVLKIAT